MRESVSAVIACALLFSLVGCDPLYNTPLDQSDPWGVDSITSTSARFFWTPLVERDLRYKIRLNLGMSVKVTRVGDLSEVPVDINVLMNDPEAAAEVYHFWIGTARFVDTPEVFCRGVVVPCLDTSETDSAAGAFTFTGLEPSTWYACEVFEVIDGFYPPCAQVTGWGVFAFKTAP